MTKQLTHYVGGAHREGVSGRYADVYNPSTGQVQAQVPLASADEVREVIANAAKAQTGWAETNPQKRARVLHRFVDLVNENADELAELVSLEHGKTIADAHGDIQRGLDVVEFATAAPHLLKGEYSDAVGTGIDVYSMRQPLGVVAGITPFNFPAMIPLWKAGPAIAAGNAFVLKPSERDPSVPLRLAELWTEAGLPDGIFNVVNGDKEAVDTLLDDPRIKAVGFVGSTPIAQSIYEHAARTGKRAQCFGGAKNHLIIMPDADLDQAADALLGAAFGSAGERCMAAAVVTVEEGIYDEFMERLTKEARNIKMGNGLDDGVFLGPVIREENLKRTISYIESGVESGAKLVCDGREDMDESGYFVRPTIFEGVTTDMKIWQDEIFAPVLSVMKIKDLKEGIEIANKSQFANGGCLFTNNASAVRYFRENMDAGMLGINLGVPAPMAMFPFSGWKSSFYGTLPANGKAGVDFYTRNKVVTARLSRNDI